MPLLLNQTDVVVHLLRIRVTALVMPYSCRSVFLYHSSTIIIPCFDNFVNGICTKKYSKNAEFLVAILCKTYTTALTDFSFFSESYIPRKIKKRPLPELLL